MPVNQNFKTFTLVAFRFFISFLTFVTIPLLSLNQAPDYRLVGENCVFTEKEKARQATITQQQLNKLKDDWRKEAAVYLQQRNEEISTLCTQKLLITDNGFNKAIQQIFSHIITSNNLQNIPVQLYLSKHPWPNAFSAGEGSLVLNVGLLPVLRNEAEVAFVICHEIAHFTLDHSIKSIFTYFQQLNNEDTRIKLKQLSKQEYNTKAMAMELLEKLTFTSRRHSRFNESSADSLALIYLNAAGYNVQVGAACMQSLDGADTLGTYVALARHFNLPGFVFEERLIKKAKTLGSGRSIAADFNTDSLKTHPDCSKRLAVMQAMVRTGSWSGGNFALLPADSFAALQRNAMFERVDGWYKLGQYDHALYEALRIVDLHPNHSFGYVQAGKILQEMCVAYKKYELGSHIHTPSGVLYTENFNELLRMTQRLTLNELINLTTAFVQHHGAKWIPQSAEYRQMAAGLPAIKNLYTQ
jgi:Zn-dependent protease with chaperone function